MSADSLQYQFYWACTVCKNNGLIMEEYRIMEQFSADSKQMQVVDGKQEKKSYLE